MDEQLPDGLTLLLVTMFDFCGAAGSNPAAGRVVRT
jgi:hypothetical protein